MRNVLLLSFYLSSTLLFSQGNLQFSQVIGQAFNSSVTSDTYVTMGTIQVPAGKVVKIESVGFYGNNGSAVEGVILIGGHVAYSKSIHNSSAMSEIQHCPIWLSEGSYPLSSST
jgi:hypothetical protein